MILVLVEGSGNQIAGVSLEMLSKAKEISEKNGWDVAAVMIGIYDESAVEAVMKYADRVIRIVVESFSNFGAYQQIPFLLHIMEITDPKIILMSHSCQGIEIAPYIATKTGIPLVTNCIDISVSGQGASVIRQVYGGQLNAQVSVENERFILTVRPGVFVKNPPGETDGDLEEITVSLSGQVEKKRLLEVVERKGADGDVDISKAPVIVSVGRGLKQKEDLKMVEELAERLGGVVACSRPLVDKGWMKHDRQVGTSGKTVYAKVYLALGISGAYQHLDGMRSCDLIISINQNPHAPISSVAHYAVIADMYEIVPKLISEFKESGNN